MGNETNEASLVPTGTKWDYLTGYLMIHTVNRTVICKHLTHKEEIKHTSLYNKITLNLKNEL